MKQKAAKKLQPSQMSTNNFEALKELAKKYENILEPQIRALYMQIVNFVVASQLPLVHVNAALDLIKKALLEQLKNGYFPEKDKK